MHFGLVAFDLYTETYEEELKNAGKPGWPISPSVTTSDNIPAAILANNIHGIDIDLRAVQLSALTLYLKAKTYRKETKITQSNLTCADILPLDGEHLSAFLAETKLTDPLYERILRALVDQAQARPSSRFPSQGRGRDHPAHRRREETIRESWPAGRS